MMDAYVLFVGSYVLAGIGIIGCLLAYFLLPKAIRLAFNVDDDITEEVEKE